MSNENQQTCAPNANGYTMAELDATVTFTHEELAAAFAEWDRRYREDPASFQSEATRLLFNVPERYGENAATYLMSVITDLHMEGE